MADMTDGNNYPSTNGWTGMGDLLGAGLLGWGMSNYQNPADSAMPYMNQISQMLPGYFNPWINAGKAMLPQLQQQYGQLVNNPGGVMNRIGAGFQQSPGYQFQTQQALNAANRAAAAGGMAGSPMEQQSIAGTVNQLANQDYYNYLNHGMSLYGQGLNGMNDMSHMGLQASSNLGEDLASALMSQAQLAYAGQANQNQFMGGSMGGIGGLISGGMDAMGAAGWL